MGDFPGWLAWRKTSGHENFVPVTTDLKVSAIGTSGVFRYYTRLLMSTALHHDAVTTLRYDGSIHTVVSLCLYGTCDCLSQRARLAMSRTAVIRECSKAAGCWWRTACRSTWASSAECCGRRWRSDRWCARCGTGNRPHSPSSTSSTTAGKHDV